ncbi:MAG: NAD(+) synthetase [Candidatus Nanohalarchaeota archaeon]|nr:MAG: NAD(+) synthetase [Candidatus Nanohaloarchaeota archaeon]
MKTLKINEKEIEKKITGFIKEKTKGFNGIVIGLSGGIDSAVCATLAAKALGKDKVHALMLPSSTTKEQDTEDANKLADHLKIKHKTINTKEIYNTIKAHSFTDNKKAHGNIMARIRMILLRDYAHSKNLLVLGTGNKSELMIGYFTKNGDSGVDILPLGDLYKTQVRALAKHLNIDKKITEKPPSAGLWQGQTDEDEIGITYETLDRILIAIENNTEPKETPKKDTDKIKNMIKTSKHKTDPTPYPKVRQ